MKKILGYISLLFIMFIPFVANAASVSIGLECPLSAAAGSTISCSVNVNSDVKVNGLVAKYSLVGASYVSFTPQAGFAINYASNEGFNIGFNSGRSGNYTIGILKLKVTNSATITIKDLDVSDVNYNSYSPINKTVTVRLKSTNNKLASLSLTGGTLSPAFNANTTSYTSTINASSVTINATKGDNYQTISGTGKKTLKYGKNTFNVVVKSESGSSRTYTIVITRPDSRNSDNYLKSLSVDKGSISFKKETLNYSVNVGKDVSSIKISAAVNDSTAKFVSGYGPRTVNLKYGDNNILVKVQAENETIRTYTIKVNRKDDRSSNSNLSSITLSSGNINFSKDVTDYSLSVPYSVTKIDVVATPEDSKSKVNVVSPDLVVGTNTILITVTSETGVSKIYKITVNRLAEEAVLSDNNNVSSIDIKGHGIEFNPDTKEYDISIGDEYALVIDVLLEDPAAKYVIEGNEDLKDGSVIKITSTSESGEVKEYKINVKKQLVAAPRQNSSGLLFGLIGFVLGLLTMFITMMLLNKMKSKKVAIAAAGVAPSVKVPVNVSTPKAEPVKAEVKPEVKEEVVETKPVEAKVKEEVKEEVKAEVAEEKVEKPKVEVKPDVVPAPKPAPAPKSAPAPAPAPKPSMQEAAVAQPVSQTVNVIPENK